MRTDLPAIISPTLIIIIILYYANSQQASNMQYKHTQHKTHEVSFKKVLIKAPYQKAKRQSIVQLPVTDHRHNSYYYYISTIFMSF